MATLLRLWEGHQEVRSVKPDLALPSHIKPSEPFKFIRRNGREVIGFYVWRWGWVFYPLITRAEKKSEERRKKVVFR